jgi:hypothetical protein
MKAPCGSKVWEHVEHKWHDFQKELHHLRIGLAMDRVNPFSNQNTNYLLWLVCIIIYNIPPWMITKKTFILISSIVLGKSQVKKMDVYMQPLVDELLLLWKEGINVVNA